MGTPQFEDGETLWVEGGAEVSRWLLWGWLGGAAGVILAAGTLIAWCAQRAGG